MRTRSSHPFARILLCLTAALLALCLGAAGAERARTLKLGMRGDDVLLAQRRLTELGYYEGEADGAFEAETRAAVRRFEAANDYAQRGTLTEAKQKRLFSAQAVSRSEYDAVCPLSSGSRSPMEKAQSAERASPLVSSISPPSTVSAPCAESAAE